MVAVVSRPNIFLALAALATWWWWVVGVGVHVLVVLIVVLPTTLQFQPLGEVGTRCARCDAWCALFWVLPFWLVQVAVLTPPPLVYEHAHAHIWKTPCAVFPALSVYRNVAQLNVVDPLFLV